MEQVKLYDTTLRDGMGGRGMSLSVGEKAQASCRRSTRSACSSSRPASRARNPKEAELFARLAELELEQRDDRAFGMTRRRDTAARGRPGAADAGRLLRSRRLPGRQDLAPAPGEGDPRSRREENLAMIADSVGFCREQGKRVDLRRRALLRRLPRRPGLRARMPGGGGRRRRRERHPLRHQRRQPAELRRRGDREVRRAARRAGRDRDPRPRRRRLRRRQLAGRGRKPGRGWCRAAVNGYGERCGNANLTTILPALQLKMGYEVVSPEQLAHADRDRRTSSTSSATSPPNPDRALRRPQRLRPQGGHARRRRRGRRQHLRAPRPRRGRQRARRSSPSELAGKATIRGQAEQRRASSSTTRRRRGRSSG